MLTDPKHFYRSYTTHELDRLMTARLPAALGVRAHEMSLYRRYFDLAAAGRKTIEIRVQYPNLRKLKGRPTSTPTAHVTGTSPISAAFTASKGSPRRAGSLTFTRPVGSAKS